MIKLCNTLLYYLTLIQANQGRYPHIFQLAMDIIPIQASSLSVPCERVFSSGKETMAPRQRHISPDLMEALQVLKYSICKGSSSLSFTEGMSWEDEIRCRLLDRVAGSHPVCPFLLSFSLCPSFLLLSFPCLLIHLSYFLLLPSFFLHLPRLAH